jgi:hypothetical protein
VWKDWYERECTSRRFRDRDVMRNEDKIARTRTGGVFGQRSTCLRKGMTEGRESRTVVRRQGKRRETDSQLVSLVRLPSRETRCSSDEDEESDGANDGWTTVED